MIAHQTLIANDGFEVALFPLPFMYISQGELMPSGYSHYNTYNMDFLGWGTHGRVYGCAMYAPCKLKVVSLWDYNGSHTVTFESVNGVHLADGTIDYLTIGFTHADNPPYHTIGDIVNQGELIYYTGTYGQSITGDHVHLTCGKGRFDEYVQRDGGHYDLSNRVHIYDALYINGTIIEHDEHDYNWKTWTKPLPSGGVTPSHFPWVLYTRKLRKNV